MSAGKWMVAGCGLVVALVGLGWWHGKVRAEQMAAEQAQAARPAARLTPVAAAGGPAPAMKTKWDPASGIVGVRKCKLRGRVTYSSEPCPTGSQELVATGGAVTVVSGQGGYANSARATEHASKSLKEKLVGPPLPDVKSKIIEKATDPQ